MTFSVVPILKLSKRIFTPQSFVYKKLTPTSTTAIEIWKLYFVFQVLVWGASDV
jgi:hypothetical protein